MKRRSFIAAVLGLITAPIVGAKSIPGKKIPGGRWMSIEEFRKMYPEKIELSSRSVIRVRSYENELQARTVDETKEMVVIESTPGNNGGHFIDLAKLKRKQIAKFSEELAKEVKANYFFSDWGP